VYTLIWGCWQ